MSCLAYTLNALHLRSRCTESHSALGLFLLFLGPSVVAQKIRKGGRQGSRQWSWGYRSCRQRLTRSLLLSAVNSPGHEFGKPLPSGGTEILQLSGKCPKHEKQGHSVRQTLGTLVSKRDSACWPQHASPGCPVKLGEVKTVTQTVWLP